MKNIIKLLFVFTAIIFSLNSCIYETFPSDVATNEQIAVSPTALEALANATAAFMNDYGGYAYDFGYPSNMIIRDVMCNDFPTYDTGYDYFNSPWCTTNYLGNYNYQQVIWVFFYNLINNAHSIIRAVDPETATTETKQYLGSSLAYRALAYMDLSREIEYKHTGVAKLDEQAARTEVTQEDGSITYTSIFGLTVPIISEKTTEEEARNNPRAPFYKMYRFIMNDLNKAETYLQGFRRSAKNIPDQSVVYGLKARLWLEMASRFRIYPEDLNAQISHENDEDLAEYDKLNITSAQNCYAKAAEYARKAIDLGVYSPLTEEQWHNTTTGFTRIDAQNSWMLGIIIADENSVKHNYINFIGNVSPEQTFGVANSKYKCFKMIGKSLYEQIPDADWRKVTWIDPADAGKNPIPEKYHTLLPDAEWAVVPAYTGFKFRPGSGNRDAYKVGAATDLPVMRIEEMYFIEAEALAYSQGLTAGVSALESFINTYRYSDGSYACGELIDADDFVDKLLVQKRIEFWAEGVIYFDYKRLEKQVIKGYTGTNYVAAQRFNSLPGYVAPWMNIFIPENESSRNKAVLPNPDPTLAIPRWQ